MNREECTVPSCIADAKAGLHRPEFLQFLKEDHRYIENPQAFIDFVDTFLTSFGKGVAFTNHYYEKRNETVNPAVFIGDADVFFAAPGVGAATYGSRAQFNQVGQIGDFFCLTHHQSPCVLGLSLEELNAFYKDPKRLEAYAKVMLGDNRVVSGDQPVSLAQIATAIGAHEALHCRDMVHAPEIDIARSQANPPDRDTSEKRKAYMASPNEVRAQRMVRMALKHYGMELQSERLSRQ